MEFLAYKENIKPSSREWRGSKDHFSDNVSGFTPSAGWPVAAAA
jgi:hypothetical protein